MDTFSLSDFGVLSSIPDGDRLRFVFSGDEVDLQRIRSEISRCVDPDKARSEESHYQKLFWSMVHRVAEECYFNPQVTVFESRRYVVSSTDCLIHLNLLFRRSTIYLYSYWRSVTEELFLCDVESILGWVLRQFDLMSLYGFYKDPNPCYKSLLDLIDIEEYRLIFEIGRFRVL